VRTLGPSDSGRAVRLRPGEAVTVRLPENAATGFRWEVAEHDPDLVEIDSSADYPDPRVGSGGEAVFTVRAMRPGETRLRLARRRSWEDPAKAAETFELDIAIEE
jgi:predicted secreted protein